MIETRRLIETRRARPARRASRPSSLLVIVATLCALTATIPLVYLVVRVVDAGVPALVETLLRERVLQLTANSVLLAVVVTASSTVLGTASAWILVRMRVPFPRIALLLAALPIAVPSYLASYGWLVIFPTLNGFWPSWLVMTAVCTPYVMLPVAAVLRGASGDLEAVARTLGHSPVRAFWAATWPRIRPAALAGALLVCLYTLSDFGAVSMLRYQTLTWGIHSAYGASFDRNQAAVLALLLVVIAIAVVGGERRVRDRVDFGTGRPATRAAASNWWLLPLGAVVYAAPIAGVLVPVAGFASRLVEAETIRALDLARLVDAVGATVALAVAGSLATVAIALPIAALAARHRNRFASVIESIGYLGHALPGIVVGLALVFFSLAVVPALYQTVVVLVFAYIVLFLPKAIGSARSGIEAVPDSLVAVARTLGLTPLRTWWRVTARLAAPSIGVGALLVGIAVMKELPATLLLRPTGISTLAVELWNRTEITEFAAAAPYAAALVVVAAVPAFVLSGVRGVAKEDA